MKIAIDIRPIGQQRTGDEVYTLNLVQNLIKIDSENFYFLLTNTKNQEEVKEIKERLLEKFSGKPENFKIVSITPRNKFLWTFFLLPLWVVKNKIDILHVQYITPLFLGKNTKLITTIHDASFDVYPEFIKKTDLFFLKTLIPLSLKKANKIIAVSDFTKEEIEKHHKISSEKIKKIYNGGATKEFFIEPTEEDFQRVSNKYKLEEPFILHIGTLQPRKNIPFLLKSFQLFQKTYSISNPEISKIKLYLTGNLKQHNFDKKIETTLNQIKEDDLEIFEKIKFIGYVDQDDMPLVFRRAKIAISTSLYEGFGLPMIEAMASKTPLISNKESSLGEIIDNAAIFYQQNNQENLAKKIFEVIIDNDLQERFIERGVTRSEYFNWGKCAQETLSLYKKLIKK